MGGTLCSFTGGDTGISICKKAGMVPIQMELGGKDACIVCAVRCRTLMYRLVPAPTVGCCAWSALSSLA